MQLNENDIFSDVYVIGEGLSSDQSAVLTFGLGDNTKVPKVVLRFVDGTEKVFGDPPINQTILIAK